MTAEQIQRNVLSKTKPVAKYDYACGFCGGTIHRGDVHVKLVIGKHNARDTYRFCVPCWEADVNE